ncbi:ANTAR domain-containing protein [Nonomuraea sp. KM90]|uniref:ANTAR domain-containing protein n=1 Tax=Nonomuraea sp. KM90 TaxID=3457428 RepID=UPI003FCD3059
MLAHGVRSVYSHPLIAREQAIAALNLYSPRTGHHAFTPPVRHAIDVTARHTGLLLHAVLRSAHQATLTDQLRQALAHREVIHEAMGIIMGQQHRTSRQAFEILRRTSQNRNRRSSTSPPTSSRPSPAARSSPPRSSTRRREARLLLRVTINRRATNPPRNDLATTEVIMGASA